MSLATRCPACGTIFRVVQDQLKVSEGWVRCGQCHEVFHGIEALFDLDSDPGIAARRAAARAPQAPTTRVFADARAGAPIPLPPPPPAVFGPSPPPPAFAPTAPVEFLPTAPASLSPLPPPPAFPARSPIAFPARTPAPVDSGRSVSATPSAFGPASLPAPADVPMGRAGFAPAPAPNPVAPVIARGTIAPRFAARLAEESARAQAAAPARAFAEPPQPELPSPTVDLSDPPMAFIPAPQAPAPEPAFAPTYAPEPAPVFAPEPMPVPMYAPEPAPAFEHAPAFAPAPAYEPAPEPWPGSDPLPPAEPAFAPPAMQPEFEPEFASPAPVPAPLPAELAAAFAAPPPAPLLPPIPSPVAEPAPASFPVALAGPPAATEAAQDAEDEAIEEELRAGPPTLASMLPEDAGEWPPRKPRKKRGDAPSSELALVDPSKDPRFLREARSGARWRKPWVRAVLSVLLIAGIVGAAGQVAWPQRDSLAARWPVTRPAWDWLCVQADCRIEAPRALASLALDGSSLTRTDTEHVLLFSADLHNRSDHEVRMPSFDLSFMDLNGAIVARKVLSPAQIGIQQAALPPEGELHVHARLQVGGLDATGFQADLFYP